MAPTRRCGEFNRFRITAISERFFSDSLLDIRKDAARNPQPLEKDPNTTCTEARDEDEVRVSKSSESGDQTEERSGAVEACVLERFSHNFSEPHLTSLNGCIEFICMVIEVK